LIADVDEKAFAHVTMRRDSSGDGDLPALGITRARLGACFRGDEFVFERIDASSPQRSQLAFALLDQ
jgi:hypothetical protein